MQVAVADRALARLLAEPQNAHAAAAAQMSLSAQIASDVGARAEFLLEEFASRRWAA
jgi:hypothetical protein